MTKQKVHKDVIIMGIAAIAIIEITALICGVNGKWLAIAMALIGIAIGIPIKSPLK